MSIENKVPAIRFKGFSGEWVSKKLGDKAEFLKGQGYSKNDLSDTGNPIILYGRLYTKYDLITTEAQPVSANVMAWALYEHHL
jgi:type I restriction enzyme, S subunit